LINIKRNQQNCL